MKMKKVLALVLALCLAMAIGVGATLAYLTAKTDTKVNTFTVGNVAIKLEELKWEESGKVEAESVYALEPLAKDPTVTNIGENPCFVRIKVEGLDCLKEKGAGDIIYRTDYQDGKLGDNWVKHTDGYYYYTKVLAKTEATDALFDQIVIPADVTNEMAGSFNIEVTAYAVQAQGARPSFTAVQAMTVEEIAAWFAVCAPADWQ